MTLKSFGFDKKKIYIYIKHSAMFAEVFLGRPLLLEVVG